MFFFVLGCLLFTQCTNEIEEGLKQPHNIHIILRDLSSSLRQLASPLFVCTTMENKVQITHLEHVKSAWVSPSMLVTSKCFLSACIFSRVPLAQVSKISQLNNLESYEHLHTSPFSMHILLIFFLNSKGFQSKQSLMPCLRLLSKV